MEDRFALLIDADNVSVKYIKPILDELSKYGNVTYKRICRRLDQYSQFQMEGKSFTEFHHADPAVQLYAGEKCNRLGDDHRCHGYSVHQ